MLRDNCDDAVILPLLHAKQNGPRVAMLASATRSFDRTTNPLELLMMTLRNGHLRSPAAEQRAI